MDESKKITAMLKAKREILEKAIPPGFYHSNDEDIKMIGVTPVESLFSNIKLDEKGTEEESTLNRRVLIAWRVIILMKKYMKKWVWRGQNFK